MKKTLGEVIDSKGGKYEIVTSKNIDNDYGIIADYEIIAIVPTGTNARWTMLFTDSSLRVQVDAISNECDPKDRARMRGILADAIRLWRRNAIRTAWTEMGNALWEGPVTGRIYAAIERWLKRWLKRNNKITVREIEK